MKVFFLRITFIKSIRFLICFTTAVSLIGLYTFSYPSETPINKKSDLVSLAQKVIRGAVGVTLEEAGTRICGPTAWKYVKTVLSPVVDELQKRYPELFLYPDEADKAAKVLSTDEDLKAKLNEGFARLESGQQVILELLAKQNATLKDIGDSIDDGFRKSEQQIDARFRELQTRLAQLQLKVESLNGPSRKSAEPPKGMIGLSPEQISNQADSYQSDAMRWVVAGRPTEASQRLSDARSLIEPALKQYPNCTQLLASMGYIEKTQAQVAQLLGDPDSYVISLEKAAKYFATILKNDPRDVSALNGMANVYLFHGDYDRAIELGKLAVQSNPDYGSAYWDLAIALESKLKVVGPEKSLVKQLITVYQRLELLMPNQPEAFTAKELAYVNQRLRALQR